MRKMLLFAVLAVAQVANAQVAITVPDEPIEAGRHYLLPVTGLDAADLPNTRLVVEPKDTASAIGVTGWAGEQFIWFAAQENGRHFVAVVVVRDGKPVVASVLVEVGGSTPNPDPPPPPPEEDLWGAVLIEETSQRTPQLAQVLTSTKLASYLETSGLTLRAADQDVTDEDGDTPEDLADYIETAKGEKLPVLFIMGVKGAEFYRGPVPETPAKLIALLKKHGGKS